MKKIIFCMMLILPMLISTTYSQKPAVMVDKKAGWHKIGSLTASFKMEKDEIVVLGADKFKSIQLKVTDAPIHISSLEVYYETGDKEDVNVASDLKMGGETRVIDLKGSNRELKKIVLVYKTVPNQKDEKATVELYGLK
jgi:hypothetical protein